MIKSSLLAFLFFVLTTSVFSQRIIYGYILEEQNKKQIQGRNLFGISYLKYSLDNYTSFYRNNSFGEWKLSLTILTAGILLSNQSAPNSGN
jgi:hypothetical protein